MENLKIPVSSKLFEKRNNIEKVQKCIYFANKVHILITHNHEKKLATILKTTLDLTLEKKQNFDKS